MTPSGMKPATFLFVAQYLDHCATAVPLRWSRKDNIQMDHKSTRCNYVNWVNWNRNSKHDLLLFTNIFCTNTFIFLKRVSVMESVHKYFEELSPWKQLHLHNKKFSFWSNQLFRQQKNLRSLIIVSLEYHYSIITNITPILFWINGRRSNASTP
jgi:hypothetical protein